MSIRESLCQPLLWAFFRLPWRFSFSIASWSLCPRKRNQQINHKIASSRRSKNEPCFWLVRLYHPGLWVELCCCAAISSTNNPNVLSMHSALRKWCERRCANNCLERQATSDKKEFKVFTEAVTLNHTIWRSAHSRSLSCIHYKMYREMWGA